MIKKSLKAAEQSLPNNEIQNGRRAEANLTPKVYKPFSGVICISSILLSDYPVSFDEIVTFIAIVSHEAASVFVEAVEFVLIFDRFIDWTVCFISVYREQYTK